MQEDWMSIAEAAKKCGVCRGAVFNAVSKGHILIKKIQFNIHKKRSDTSKIYVQKRVIKCVNAKDLEEYRKNKYLSTKRMFEGIKIHDIAEHRFSVTMASKWFAEVLGKHISNNTIYYLIRKGEITARRIGKALVIDGKDLFEFYLKDSEKSMIDQEIIV